MPTASSLKGKPQKKSRGNIEELPSGALRVRVYAGKDPITGRRYGLKELVPAGPDAQRQAQRILNKFLHQIDERRHPKTNATVNQLLDRYLDQLNVERSTKSTYVVCVNKHIRPLIGTVKAGRVDVEIIDSLHAELRRCREHCRGKGMVDHRTPLRHECDDRCRRHRCRPLAPWSILKVHQILTGAFSKAIRWGWITINPMEGASAPSPGASNPQPPSAEEAAALLNRAWRNDPTGGRSSGSRWSWARVVARSVRFGGDISIWTVACCIWRRPSRKMAARFGRRTPSPAVTVASSWTRGRWPC